MSLKTLLLGVAIVASASSAALADTTFSASGSVRIGGSASWDGPVIVRDHGAPVYQKRPGWDRPRYEQPRHEPQIFISHPRVNAYGSTYMGGMRSTSWGRVMISQPTRIENGREDFLFQGNRTSFNSVSLRAVAGTSFVSQVTIQFADHSTQVVRLDRYLDPRDPVLTIDLQGHHRQLLRVMVYGQSRPGAAYQLMVE